MKIITKKQAIERKNSNFCTAFEYPLGIKDINGAVVEINGRYPDKGRVVNAVCKELGYIISGSGKIVVEGNKVVLNEGDLIFLEPNEKYYWEGKLKMFMSCVPAWYPEQHKEVD